MHDAKALAGRYPDAAVPFHLRNAPTKLMKDLGYGKGLSGKLASNTPMVSCQRK